MFNYMFFAPKCKRSPKFVRPVLQQGVAFHQMLVFHVFKTDGLSELRRPRTTQTLSYEVKPVLLG